MEKPLENNILRVKACEVNPDEIKYRCPFYGHTCDKEFHHHGNNLYQSHCKIRQHTAI